MKYNEYNKVLCPICHKIRPKETLKCHITIMANYEKKYPEKYKPNHLNYKNKIKKWQKIA